MTNTSESLNLLRKSISSWNRWRARNPNISLELSRVNLSGVDLYNVNLSEANLSRANLNGTDLSRADLSKADLSRTDLSGADLSGANLYEADLVGANLNGADLSGTDLRKANLSEADCVRADFVRTDLRTTKLIKVDLREANLSEADLRDADLREADLTSANLHEATLSRVDLFGSRISQDTKIGEKWRLVWEIVNHRKTGRNLQRLDLSGAYLAGADLAGSNLCGVNLCGANLQGVDFRGANLKDAQIDQDTKIDEKWRLVWEIVNQGAEGRDLKWADLSEANLCGANLCGANLKNANLRMSNLKDVQIDQDTEIDEKWRLVWEIVNQGAEGRDLQGVDLSGAYLGGVKFSWVNLCGANLQGVDFRGANLKDAQIDQDTKIDEKWRLVWEIVNQGAEGRDFKWADLSEANLCGANLKNANLRMSNLKDVQIDQDTEIDEKWRLVWEIVNQGAEGRDLQGVDLGEVNLMGANLCGANLRGANLQGVDFCRADLSSTNLQEANLRNANLRNANLRYSNLEYAILDGADLRNADLDGADLRNTDLYTADPMRTHHETMTNDTDLSPEEIRTSMPSIRGTDLRGVSLPRDSGLNLAEAIYASLDNSPETLIRYIIRYGSISFPERTLVGITYALRITITIQKPDEHAVSLAVSTDELLEITVLLNTSELDFDLQGSNVQTITVLPDQDSPPVMFRLIPKREGQKKSIKIQFFQNATRYLGEAKIETTIVQSQVSSDLVNNQLTLSLDSQGDQPKPDLIILVDQVRTEHGKYYYLYKLESRFPELNLCFRPFRTSEKDVSPQKYLEEVYERLSSMSGLSNSSETRLVGRLKSIGNSLYDYLFPDDLKQLYWNELRDEVKTIIILSTEPWIPWELICPYHPETNQSVDGFLCEKFSLTRWLQGDHVYPDTINLERLGLIVPPSNLESADLEAKGIKSLFENQTEDINPSIDTVYSLLKTGGFSGLHFICHGQHNRDNPDLSTLELADDDLSPIDISGEKLVFRKDCPLVFLNACNTAQGGHALTGLGGWAEAFIGRAQSSCFVGSTWEADDESAQKFAVAFYRNLLKGQTVGDAVKQARLEIKKASDPTWLSYTVYANPLAYLSGSYPGFERNRRGGR